MWSTLYNKVKFGPEIEEISTNEQDKCRVISAKGINGKAVFKVYSIFQGVFIMFSNVEMKECSDFFQYHFNLLCIDHCREGKIEHKVGNKYHDFLKSGELKISIKKEETEKIIFPLGTYSGITVIFELDVISKEMTEILDGFSNRIHNLRSKYCDETNTYTLSGNESIEHIFSELYTVPLKIQDEYFKIKVIEILLFLEANEVDKCNEQKPYFNKSQIEKIKLIHEFLTQNISKNYTIDDLSKLFNISPTPLKECFKMVYGVPIFTYMQSYRMNYAAKILKDNGDCKIIDVAGLVGYDSPSKFSATFKKKMGVSPRDYRKSFRKI